MNVVFDLWISGVDAAWVRNFEKSDPRGRWEMFLQNEREHPGCVLVNEAQLIEPGGHQERCPNCDQPTLEVVVHEDRRTPKQGCIYMACPCGYRYYSSTRPF